MAAARTLLCLLLALSILATWNSRFHLLVSESNVLERLTRNWETIWDKSTSYSVISGILAIRTRLLHRRLSYCANGSATFNPELLKIVRSGDVHPLPGPETNSSSGPTTKPTNQAGTNSQCLRCCSFNAQSLRSLNRLLDGTLVSNLSSFQDLVYTENFDLITVTETWLNENISNSEILPSGYSIIRKDRPIDKRGGGVLIALRNEIQFTRITSGIWYDRLEIIAIELVSTNTKKCLACVCYRPPNYDLDEWMVLFTSFLETATSRYEFVLITGDFNFPDLTWNSELNTDSVRDISSRSAEFRELTYDFFSTTN